MFISYMKRISDRIVFFFFWFIKIRDTTIWNKKQYYRLVLFERKNTAITIFYPTTLPKYRKKEKIETSTIQKTRTSLPFEDKVTFEKIPWYMQEYQAPLELFLLLFQSKSIYHLPRLYQSQQTLHFAESCDS